MIRKTETVRAVIAGFLLLALSGSVLAAENIPGSVKIKIGDEPAVYLKGEKLTLGEAVRLAIESNYDIISGAYELAMLDSNFRSYQKKYAPFLNVEGSWNYQEFPDSTSLLTGSDQETWSGSAALVKNFPTGTQLSLGLSHDYTETAFTPFDIPGLDISFGDPRTHQPAAFISLKQELLQNGLGFIEQREQRQIVNVALMRKDQILHQLSGVVVKVVVDYWSVVLRESALNNAQLQLQETRAVRDITARNADLGLANTFELHYYNVLVAGAEAQWLAAQQQYRDAKRGFLQSINLKDGALLEGTAVLVDTLPDLDQQKALTTAYAKRPDYLNAKRMQANAEWELAMSENQALPSLTAELSLNAMSQRPDAGEAYERLFVPEQKGYLGKLTLTYPLGDPLQEIKARNARFARKQSEINMKKYERKILDDIEGQIEQMKTLHRIYQATQQARREAEKFYQRMVSQMRRGRLNASLVKNGVDALAESRQRELETLIQFNMLQLQFIVTKNELFETFGIEPDKYIPKDE